MHPNPPTPPPLPPTRLSQKSGSNKQGGNVIGRTNHLLSDIHSRRQVDRDSFSIEVSKKAQALQIGRPQAEVEVLLDHHIAEQKTKAAALLGVVKEESPESKVNSLVTALLQRGATTNTLDRHGRSAVFHAVIRGFTQVLRKLLEAGAAAHIEDKLGKTPLQLALDKKNDDMCALLVAYMPNQEVQEYFLQKPPRLNFHDLLHSNMEQTILGVLDCLIDETSNGECEVHFNLLESDENGNPPNHPAYNKSGKSAIHVMAATKNIDAVFHDAVRLLLQRKWICYARRQFIISAILHVISVIALTFALIVGIDTSDPLVYNSPLQYARGASEVLCCLYVLSNLGMEITQLYRSRSDYLKDPFNWLDMSAILLLLVVIPLRFTATLQSWPVFGVGYCLWTMRTFKYSAITRSTGAFAQILWSILTQDMVQFLAVFIVVLLSFSGLLLTTMKFEGFSYQFWETKSFWATLLTGTRTLVEQQPVFDYVGEDGLGPLSVTAMLLFLFATLVVLLNILIARLSDTYQNVQRDAQRGLELDRAWIITRLERNSFCFNFRTKYYQEVETVQDLQEKLEKWESAPKVERTRLLEDLQEKLENQDVYLRNLSQRLHASQLASQRMQSMLTDLNNHIKQQAILASHGPGTQAHPRPFYQ
jgi:hypothetical protein